MGRRISARSTSGGRAAALAALMRWPRVSRSSSRPTRPTTGSSAAASSWILPRCESRRHGFLLGPPDGVASQGAMTRRIAHYRREPIAPGEDPDMGCVGVRDVTFFPDDLTFEPPPEFYLERIVQGKSYDMGHARSPRTSAT